VVETKEKPILIHDRPYDWREMSLWEFLIEGNIPSKWTDFFLLESVQYQLWLISEELDQVRQQVTIYPMVQQVFRAFYMVAPEKIRAVIVGQDPYHNGTNDYDGSAVGLCFSVRPGNKINPSLRNIYKELRVEGYEPVENGDLTNWAHQGVFLINMALTVEKGNAGSHSCMWYQFSLLLIQYIVENYGENIHWLLFGKDAHDIVRFINKGHIHCCSHPSPLSANRPCGKYGPFMKSGIFQLVKGIEW